MPQKLLTGTRLVAPVGARSSGRIAVVELVTDLWFKTMGTSMVWLPVGDVLEIGAEVEDIVGHLECTAPSDDTDFKYLLGFGRSYDGERWYDMQTPCVLSTELAGPGYTITGAFNDRTKFGRYIRFLLGVRHQNAERTGRLSASVAIKFWAQ